MELNREQANVEDYIQFKTKLNVTCRAYRH